MQDLENNMDELLRKAAENYGLKKGASNWDSIAKELKYETVQISTTKKNNHAGRYAATLMLLLLFLFTFSTLNKNYTTAINTGVTFNTSKVQQETADVKEKSITNSKATAELNRGKASTYTPGDMEQVSSKKQLLQIKEGFNNVPGIKNRLTTPAKLFSVTKQQNDDEINSSASIIKSNTENIKENNLSDKEQATATQTTAENNNKNPSVNPKKNDVRKLRGFYAGMIAGASFDAVKYQGIRKPGFDIGLLAGYKVSNKVSVETGLFFAKKNYYSDGKYFSMQKVGATMPQDMQVLSLEGSSQLLEIPLKIKYALLQKRQSTIYAAAGISSYVLLKEKNNYLTLLNGDKQNITSIYSKSSGYFAGSVDLSAGYEFKTGNRTNLRIEPYIQIPLKGIGVGALPVMSAGLRLGFTIPSR